MRLIIFVPGFEMPSFENSVPVIVENQQNTPSTASIGISFCYKSCGQCVLWIIRNNHNIVSGKTVNCCVEFFNAHTAT